MFDVHAFVDLHHSLFLVNRHKCDRKASEPLSHFILFHFILFSGELIHVTLWPNIWI